MIINRKQLIINIITVARNSALPWLYAGQSKRATHESSKKYAWQLMRSTERRKRPSYFPPKI